MIDTSTVAPHERVEMWSAATSALFFPTRVRSVEGMPFSGVMAQYALGLLNVFRVRGAALVLERTADGVAAADPEFFALSMPRSGRLQAGREDRASCVGPGTMSVYDSSRRLRDLQDPALAHEPIFGIATRWGFASASHFSHAARGEYGCSANELRAPAT